MLQGARSLFEGIPYHTKTYPPISVLLIGLDEAGKTTLVQRLTQQDISPASPTKGFQLKSFIHDGYDLKIWDVGGQKLQRTQWKKYYAPSNVIIFMIDGSDITRFDEAGLELNFMLQETYLSQIPLLIFINKRDLKGYIPVQELSTGLNLSHIRDRSWKALPCSARTGDGIIEGIEWVTQTWREKTTSKSRFAASLKSISIPNIIPHRQKQVTFDSHPPQMMADQPKPQSVPPPHPNNNASQETRPASPSQHHQSITGQPKKARRKRRPKARPPTSQEQTNAVLDSALLQGEDEGGEDGDMENPRNIGLKNASTADKTETDSWFADEVDHSNR